MNEKLKKNKILSVIFLIIALVTPSWCGVIVFYAIGSFFLLLSVSALFENSKFFKSRILAFLGKESFAIIIVHALVLFSVNANLFLYLNSLGINQNVNFFSDLSMASLVAQMVKHLPAMQDTRVQSLGWEDPLEKEIGTHSSTLAWKIPWTEEPCRLQSMGSQRVGYD